MSQTDVADDSGTNHPDRNMSETNGNGAGLMPEGQREMQDRDFTGGNIAAEATRATLGDVSMDRTVSDLVDFWLGDNRRSDLVAELVTTAMKAGKDNTSVADLKLMNRSLREMRRANKVFEEFRHLRKISVFGSARTRAEEPVYQMAVEFSKRMTAAGFMVITGAGDGIMGAAQLGAGRENSFGLNIQLPFEQGANATIKGDPKLMSFKYFFTRKLSFVKESDAFAAFPGGFGTIDETFEALTLIQTGKATIMPIVLLDIPGGDYWQSVAQFFEKQLLARKLISPEDAHLYHITSDLDEAVREVTTFYRVFHSYRYVGKKISVRLKARLTTQAVDDLNSAFADLFNRTLEQRGHLPEEVNEEGILHLPRLVGDFTRRSFGRLRQFIDALNAAQIVKAKP
jgi:uncharacterized protein (TIGR00730 family)